MTNAKDVILKLKEVKKEKDLSLDKILAMIEENNEFVSKSTLSRVFSDGSEEKGFRYENTLRPIANALLDIETIEIDDDLDTQAMKSILQLKKNLLWDLEKQVKELKEELQKAKLKYHEKLAVETERFQKSLDFAMNQIELKDKRIDHLLTTNDRLMATSDRLSITNNRMLNQILDCPLKNKGCDFNEG